MAAHYEETVRYCRLLCANWPATEAEDVLQQALLYALEHYAELRDPQRFKPWLFRIVTTTFRMARRRAFWQRFLPLSVELERSMPAVYRETPPLEAEQLVQHALACLSAKERTAILLFEVAGFRIDEIQNMQGDRSLSAVKSRLSRARRKLRTHLATEAQALAQALQTVPSLNTNSLTLLAHASAGSSLP